ncbi:MAG: MCP four helix bundle domain-containing protein, partial [Rhodoferax sp.]
MNLNNLKISSRLIFGFGVLGLLIALMGGVSLLKVGVMNSLFNQVIDERVPSIATTNEVKGDLNLISIALRNTMMMRDADGIKTEVNRIEAARVRINANLARLDAQTTSDTGKAVLARVAQVRRQYDPMQAEVMALVNAGSFFEARTLLMD